jgi:chromate transport protein ChrA
VPLLGLGVVVMLLHNRAAVLRTALLVPPDLAAAQSAAPVGFSLGALFLTFLKIGATLYGSGYVLLAFLHHDFVARLGWLTDQASIVDVLTAGLAAVAAVLLIRFRLNSAWLVLGGGVVGLVAGSLRG